MRVKNLFLLLVIVLIELLVITPSIDAKRSFGLTRSRNKSKTPSVRRNSHGANGDFDGPDPKLAQHNPKPSAPVGHPQGPPPAYPGMRHNAAAPNGMPPSYSANFGHPPSYSASMGHNQPKQYGQSYGQSFNNQHQQSSSNYYGLNNANHQPSYARNTFTHAQTPYGGNHIGGNPTGMGMMGGGMSPYGYGHGHYASSSPFSMGNIFAGLAVWQIARGIGGGHHSNRDHEVDVYDHRGENNNPQEPIAPIQDNQGNTGVNGGINYENTQQYGVSQPLPLNNDPIFPAPIQNTNEPATDNYAQPPIPSTTSMSVSSQ